MMSEYEEGTVSPHNMSKESILEQFPPHIDCDTLLFSGEQIRWAQKVPPLRRLTLLPMAMTILGFILATVVALYVALFAHFIRTNTNDELKRPWSLYMTISCLFFIGEILLLYSVFGGDRVDVVTNLRVFRSYIYWTSISTESISHESISNVVTRSSSIKFLIHVHPEDRRLIHSLFPPSLVLPYVPESNNSIINNASTIVAAGTMDARALFESDDAIGKLQDQHPFVAGDEPSDPRDPILWLYKPQKSEVRRFILLSVLWMTVYIILISIGMFLPMVLSIADESSDFALLLSIFWIVYAVFLVAAATEYNEKVIVYQSRMAVFTVKLLCSPCAAVSRTCARRITYVSHSTIYPLQSVVYRTSTSTPTQFTKLRSIQRLFERVFAYTNGYGSIKLSNKTSLRVPNVHDFEWALLQKHYQALAAPVAVGLNNNDSINSTTMAPAPSSAIIQ